MLRIQNPLYFLVSSVTFLNIGVTMAYLHSFGIQFFVYLLFRNCCNLSLNSSGAYLYNSELILPTSEILLFFANFEVFSNSSDAIKIICVIV